MILIIQLVIAILDLIKTLVEKLDKVKVKAVEMRERAIVKKVKKKAHLV